MCTQVSNHYLIQTARHIRGFWFFTLQVSQVVIAGNSDFFATLPQMLQSRISGNFVLFSDTSNSQILTTVGNKTKKWGHCFYFHFKMSVKVQQLLNQKRPKSSFNRFPTHYFLHTVWDSWFGGNWLLFLVIWSKRLTEVIARKALPTKRILKQTQPVQD